MRIKPVEVAIKQEYDAVVVGGGIMGAIVAKKLNQAGKSVLILEAGSGVGKSYEEYLEYLGTYYQANIKIPNAPYPSNPNAPEPTVLDPTVIKPGKPDTNGYFVQNGPLPFLSSYTRYLGGTTLHWLGTSLRMLPEDFQLQTKFGVGNDWPITYEELAPYYDRAEYELGVSADVDEQAYGGITFSDNYVYPMHRIPSSWSDLQLAKDVDGMKMDVDGEKYALKVRSTPASRNSIPNAAYDHGKGYQTVGAVGNSGVGHRCMGNSSCVPICPIQAKYNALKTLNSTTDLTTLVTQSVVSNMEIDTSSGRVTGLSFKHYASTDSPDYTMHTAKGKIYVLAAHAVENAKLLLASNVGNRSDTVGRYLMDHTELVTWGRASDPRGAFRGPLSTSGIESLRYGQFRSKQSAFRIEMGNDGWSWPTGAPASDVTRLIDQDQQYGKSLKKLLFDQVSSQIRFGFLVEQLPNWGNRVTVEPQYTDRLGNYRPVISYDIDDYTRAGFEFAKEVSDRIFAQAGVVDYSSYQPNEPGYFEYNGKGYTSRGAGHFAGTHRMGSSADDSVVNREQRSWDHENLYMVGCGNMVTTATSNPTLTAAALTFWAAENIVKQLG